MADLAAPGFKGKERSRDSQEAVQQCGTALAASAKNRKTSIIPVKDAPRPAEKAQYFRFSRAYLSSAGGQKTGMTCPFPRNLHRTGAETQESVLTFDLCREDRSVKSCCEPRR
jgi:hypothetical protein